MLPGGLTRVAMTQRLAGGELVAGRRQQGHLGAGASGRRRVSSSNDASSRKPLLSRVAESVYWMARYIERAENVARFIGVNQNLMLDLPGGFGDQWQPIVDTTGDRAAFLERYGAATQENVVRFLAFDPENPELHLFLRPGGPRKCALGARDHLLGNVGADQHACTC